MALNNRSRPLQVVYLLLVFGMLAVVMHLVGR